jgi:hypothetical protein
MPSLLRSWRESKEWSSSRDANCRCPIPCSDEITTKRPVSFCELRVGGNVHLVGEKGHKRQKPADPKGRGNRSDYTNRNLMIFRIFEALFEGHGL